MQTTHFLHTSNEWSQGWRISTTPNHLVVN